MPGYFFHKLNIIKQTTLFQNYLFHVIILNDKIYGYAIPIRFGNNYKLAFSCT